MRTAIAAVLLSAALVCPAQARMSKAVLDDLGAQPRAGARLPLGARFADETGASRSLGEAIGERPALLVFADFTCRTLCGPMVEFAAAGLQKTGLRPGRDFRFLIVGIDPKDGIDAARALKVAHVDAASALYPATQVLSGNEAAVRAATAAAGYRFSYDAADDQFAHPAAAFVLDPGGRIVRVLSALALNGTDLRLALVDAAEGRIGTFEDRIRLLCYGFDPAKGIYTPSILRWLTVAAFVTAALLAGAIAFMLWRGPRKASP